MRNLYVLAGLVGLLTACASVDFEHPKTESFAYTDTADSLLGKQVAAFGEVPEGYGRFFLLRDSIDALSSRLLLAERAERSIDAQYYLAYADRVGYLCLQALLAAAERGVRVRLLLDDFLTGGLTEGLLAMDSHRLIEVRIYNPFSRRSFRFGDFIMNFQRVNRRMHNKVYIVDNQVAIIGGRNIAEEYFGAGTKYNFGDLDILGIGPVTTDASTMFDSYWNHPTSVPIHALASPPSNPEQALAKLRARMQVALAGLESSPYQAALEDSTVGFMQDGVKLGPRAPYEFVYDPPVKPDHRGREGHEESIVTALRSTLEKAQEEVIVASPYFVVADDNIKRMGEYVKKGVTLKIITNSLASTNHTVVHSGYAPTRKPLLEEGVNIYEVRPDSIVAGVSGDRRRKSSLHTKAFIVDRRWLYLGSFNWDPRSTYINTESGIIIDNEDLAREIAERVDLLLPSAAYTVFLDENQNLRWETLNTDGTTETFTKEPETSAWTRFKVWFMSLLPIKGQL